MPQNKIIQLAQRVASSDANNAVEQRSLLEALAEIRTLVDREAHPRACDYLNGAGLLLTFTQHFGHVGGVQILGVVATVLEAAHMHVSKESTESRSASTNAILTGGTQWGAVQVANDMLLGQILIRKGYIVEEQVKEAVELQASSGARFGEALMKLGALDWPKLEEGLRYQDACRNIVEGVAETQRPQSTPPTMTKRIELAPASDSELKLMSDVLLGEILLRNSLVTQEQLESALVAQRGSGMRIGEVLVGMGACPWNDINYAVQLQGQLRRYAS